MKKLILISVLLTFSITCFSQEGKWKKAQKINTIESYQEFIDKYPQSEFYEDAKLKIIDLENKRAKLIEKRNLEIQEAESKRLERSDEWKTTGNIKIFWELSDYLYEKEADKAKAEKYLGNPTKIYSIVKNYSKYIVWEYSVKGMSNADNVKTGIAIDPSTNKVNGKFTYLTENGHTTRYEEYK